MSWFAYFTGGLLLGDNFRINLSGEVRILGIPQVVFSTVKQRLQAEFSRKIQFEWTDRTRENKIVREAHVTGTGLFEYHSSILRLPHPRYPHLEDKVIRLYIIKRAVPEDQNRESEVFIPRLPVKQLAHVKTIIGSIIPRCRNAIWWRQMGRVFDKNGFHPTMKGFMKGHG